MGTAGVRDLATRSDHRPRNAHTSPNVPPAPQARDRRRKAQGRVWKALHFSIAKAWN